jgi:acyl-CoA synthetase (AMP-forming)/AMP-acid ligase II
MTRSVAGMWRSGAVTRMARWVRYRSNSYSGRPSRSAQAVATAELGVSVPGTVAQPPLCFASWYEEIARVAGGLIALGLRCGDRLVVTLRNRLEMASLHWACQFAGIVVTPLNWRIKLQELDCGPPAGGRDSAV